MSEIYIWGNDYFGQLGIGEERVTHNIPKVCSFNICIAQVACGDDHTVFVSSPSDGGYVYSMGSNVDGKLGLNNSEIRSVNVPTLVDGICNIIKVGAGNAHSVALGSDGKAYTWGQSFYGALGLPQGT